MASRSPTDAAVLKQLKTVTEKISSGARGEQRLELLRRQAALVDQRDAAVDKARRAAQ